MKTNVLRKVVNMWEPSVMSADEAMEWLGEFFVQKSGTIVLLNK